MKSYTIYKSSRFGVLECVAFMEGKVILRTSMAKDVSAPVNIETAKIRLISDYDSEQTLIPGVTRRTVYYAGKNIRFCDIRWNKDESYTVDFDDEELAVVHNDQKTFTFEADGKKVGIIIKDTEGSSLVHKDGVRYESAYTVEFDEGVSQQAQIMIMVFPLLYFGF